MKICKSLKTKIIIIKSTKTKKYINNNEITD